jgi:hypothetical protein
VAFRFWVWERILKVIGERKWSVSRYVNDAVEKHLEESLGGDEAKRFLLLAESDKLLSENQYWFELMKLGGLWR